MIIPLTMIPYVNIFIIVFVAIMLFLGYQRGFLYQVFSLLGVLSAICFKSGKKIKIFPILIFKFKKSRAIQ